MSDPTEAGDTEEGGDPVSIAMLTSDPLRLDGMRALLESDGAFRVVPLTSSGGSGERVAIVDADAVIHLESLVRQMCRAKPQVGILVLGPEADFERIMAVVGYGARGYLSYTITEKELRMALQVVMEGSIWAPRKVLALLLARKVTEPTAPAKLTPREKEVLQLLTQGRPNRQIAEALSLDETTVKAHLGRIMRKLGVRNRIALSLLALDKLGPLPVD